MIRAVHSFFTGSEPVRFRSGYGLHDSVERLGSVAKRSALSALSGQAAVGKVTETEVSLERVIPLVGNSFKPLFIGRFETAEGAVELVGRFVIRRSTRIFSAIWAGFILLWIILAAFAVASRPSEWYVPLFGIGMLFVGALIMWLGMWFSRNDVGWLSNVIRTALSRHDAD